MKIHAISTGRVRITRHGMVNADRGPLRWARTLLDREFTHWLPVYCWVIDHPEGLIVVDTGLSADIVESTYLPAYLPFVRHAVEYDIAPQRELAPQMRNRQLYPDQVRWVILTHLHPDHAGGLAAFPQAEVLVARTEWERATGWLGRMRGYRNDGWSDGLDPTLVDFEDGGVGAWEGSRVVTERGDLRLVPTPGHTPGHLSVILDEPDQTLFFAGDAAYSQPLLVGDHPDGFGPDLESQHATREAILHLAATEPTVFLPTHEWGARGRLNARETIPPDLTAARPNVPLYIDMMSEREKRLGRPVRTSPLF
jgi:glyoxylase-like metal-dependent hydrolase (beta-lactamase superfamily II)